MLTTWIFYYQVVNGATYVKIDMVESKKNGTRMLLVEGAKKPSLSCMGGMACFMNWLQKFLSKIFDVFLLVCNL